MEIIALIIAVIAIPCVYSAIVALIHKIRIKRWSTKLQFDNGLIPELKDHAFEYWVNDFKVDENGNSKNRIKLKMINISTKTIYNIKPPIYGTSNEPPLKEQLGLWAKSGKTDLSIKSDSWDSKLCRGRVIIKLDPPLEPEHSRIVEWGYSIPKVFQEGNEFIQWDISSDTYIYAGSVTFHGVWKILSPRWVTIKNARLPALTIKGDKILWKVPFPSRKQRYRFEFGLTKQSSCQDKSETLELGEIP